MGLDNYPEPYPCTVLEEAGKLKIVRNEDGDTECEATHCPFTTLPTGCWIRGKVFNTYVQACCGESLYTDKTRAELESILPSLKEHYRRTYPENETTALTTARAQLHQLIEYVEILLSVTDWNGRLVASF